jgi:(R,R)-butanediol dehydrogenase / meso-butanediol dehydrogenase / diacetyl reductase
VKAATLKRQSEMAIVDVPKPTPGCGEVLLKIHNCGICGSDLSAYQHGLGMPAYSIMGHEFCGEVCELGPGVRALEIRQRVAVLPFVACGACNRCRHGMELHCRNIRGLGFGQLPGGYAEFVACKASNLFKLPDNVSSRDGALVEPLSVGLHAVKRYDVGPVATVIVLGAGPIGLATMIWAKAMGAVVVIAEIAEGRREIARKLGADVVLNPGDHNPADQVRVMTGSSPQLIFDCAGAKGTLQKAIYMAGPCARVVVVGICMEADIIQPLMCVSKEINIDFVRGYDRSDFATTIKALSTGTIRPQSIVTDVIRVDEVPTMFESMRQPGSHGKVLIEFPY